MAFLKKKNKADEAAVEVEDSRPEEVVDPGAPQIPGSSYNMMTIRYVVEQRRSLVALIIAGAAAAALILMVGSWLTTRGAISDVQGEKLILEQEMATLSEQITDLADTGGLTPERVMALRNDRLTAFATATYAELDYQTIIEKLSTFNTSRAWLESFSFSSDGSKVVVTANGRAVSALDVTYWYDSVNQGLAGEAWVEQSWAPAGFAGTPDAPGQFPATVTFEAPMATDRATPLGIDPEVVSNVAPRPASTEGAEGGTEDGSTTTVPADDTATDDTSGGEGS